MLNTGVLLNSLHHVSEVLKDDIMLNPGMFPKCCESLAAWVPHGSKGLMKLDFGSPAAALAQESSRIRFSWCRPYQRASCTI